MAEYFRDERARTCCSSSTTSSASPRPAPRFRRCWAACPPRSATSRRWRPRWASSRSGSPRPSKGSITSVQAIYVPADDLTDPAPATTFAHLDATTVLSRGDRREGHLPGGRSAGLDLAASSTRTSSARSTTTSPASVQRDPAALQGPAGHHRHPRHGRAVGRGQAHSSAAPARSSASSRSRSSSPRRSPARPASTSP